MSGQPSDTFKYLTTIYQGSTKGQSMIDEVPAPHCSGSSLTKHISPHKSYLLTFEFSTGFETLHSSKLPRCSYHHQSLRFSVLYGDQKIIYIGNLKISQVGNIRRRKTVWKKILFLPPGNSGWESQRQAP